MRGHMEENKTPSQYPAPTARHKSKTTLGTPTLQLKAAAQVNPSKARGESVLYHYILGWFARQQWKTVALCLLCHDSASLISIF